MHITIPFAPCNYQGGFVHGEGPTETCALGKFLFESRTVVQKLHPLKYSRKTSFSDGEYPCTRFENGPLEEGITNLEITTFRFHVKL